MSKIILRQAKLSDLQKMKALNEKALQENYDYVYWKAKWDISKEHCYVAVSGNDVVGYIFADEKTIISVAIDEKYRNRKIGTELLKHVLNTYLPEDKGSDEVINERKIKLHVRMKNESAKKLYTNYGFIEHKVFNDYYRNPVEDAIEMICITKTKYQTVNKMKIKF